MTEQEQQMNNVMLAQQLAQMYTLWFMQQTDKVALVSAWQEDFIDQYKKQIKWDEMSEEDRAHLISGIEYYRQLSKRMVPK